MMFALPATVLLSAAALTSAWNLDIYGTDGRHANFHGTLDSGCNTISFTPVINVNRAVFSPATNNYPDPGTFELYVNRGCSGLSYRSGSGSHSLVPAREIRSYKVY